MKIKESLNLCQEENSKQTSKSFDVPVNYLNPKNNILLCIEDLIQSVDYHRFENTTAITCCITLKNGVNEIGQAHLISYQDFDLELGKHFAKENAIKKLYEKYGFFLKMMKNFSTDNMINI